jgi:hypothetical protein
MEQEPHALGSCRFADGSTRTVYQDAAGRQFVLNDDNRRVYGSWLLPRRATDPDKEGQARD